MEPRREIELDSLVAVAVESAHVRVLLRSLGATDGEYLYHVVQTLLDGARNPYQSGVALLLAKTIAGEVPAEVVRFAAAVQIIDVAAFAHRQTAGQAALAPTEQPAIDAHLIVLAGDYLYAQAAYITAGLQNLHVMAILAEEIKSQCRGEIKRLQDTGTINAITDLYSLSVLGTGHLLGCETFTIDELRAYGAALHAANVAARNGDTLPPLPTALLGSLPAGPGRDGLLGLIDAVYQHVSSDVPMLMEPAAGRHE